VFAGSRGRRNCLGCGVGVDRGRRNFLGCGVGVDRGRRNFLGCGVDVDRGLRRVGGGRGLVGHGGWSLSGEFR
jgi:hypothetical protein